MNKEAWFRNYERLIDNGAPHGCETAELARQIQREQGSILDRADEARKRERELPSETVTVRGRLRDAAEFDPPKVQE